MPLEMDRRRFTFGRTCVDGEDLCLCRRIKGESKDTTRSPGCPSFGIVTVCYMDRGREVWGGRSKRHRDLLRSDCISYGN